MSFKSYQFLRNENESEKDYRERCYSQKLDSDITWNELTIIMNDQLGKHLSESTYRKSAKKFFMSEKDDAPIVKEDTFDVDYIDDLNELLLELRKERYKISEERTQNNVYVRKLSREETLKEIAADYAGKMSAKKFLDKPLKVVGLNNSSRAGIVCISDWHYGMDFHNYFNIYNPEVCVDRVHQLQERIIEIGKLHNIKHLYVVNLSDLIAGRIHLTIRLESRCDVISQIMEVSEILAELLTNLSHHFVIHYGDVMDNHSRLEPNKNDSLELETLVRIIPWYLKQRLNENTNVLFIDNDYSDDIVDFNVLRHNVVAVHGHKDKPVKVIENMTSMTRRRNDLVLTAHLHHFGSDEEHECLRISNGSLMGVDTYAQDLRLTNRPSQTMIIVSEEDVAEAIYKINLK